MISACTNSETDRKPAAVFEDEFLWDVQVFNEGMSRQQKAMLMAKARERNLSAAAWKQGLRLSTFRICSPDSSVRILCFFFLEKPSNYFYVIQLMHSAGVLVLQEEELSKKLRGFEANPFKIQDRFE